MTGRRPIFVKSALFDVFCPTFFALRKSHQARPVYVTAQIFSEYCNRPIWRPIGYGLVSRLQKQLIANREA